MSFKLAFVSVLQFATGTMAISNIKCIKTGRNWDQILVKKEQQKTAV